MVAKVTSKLTDTSRCVLSTADLKAALSWLRKCTKPKGISPVLAGVLIQTTDERIKLSVTDGDGCCSAVLEAAEVSGPFGCAVNAETLYRIVSLLRDESITLESLRDTLSVAGDDSRLMLPTTPGDGFPTFPPPVGDAHHKIMAGVLLDTHRMVSAIIPDDDDPKRRFQFRGILTEVKDAKLVLQATNGRAFVMASGTAPFQNTPAERKNQCIVSDDAFRLIAAATKDDRDADCRVWLEKNTVHFQTDAVSVSYRLLEGKFPDGKKWIIDAHKTAATVKMPAVALKDAVNRAAVVHDMGKFTVEDGESEMRIETEKEASNAVVKISVPANDCTGEDAVTLDLNFLRDGIKSLADDDVLTLFLGGKTPTKIEARDGDFLMALAPIVEK